MKTKKIISYVVLALVAVFSIYEIVILSLDLASYTLDLPRSYASYIWGIIVFSLILVSSLALIIYQAYLDYKKKYYVLKK